MAYAEKIKSVAGDYWRGKFKGPEGKYVSVRDGDNRVRRFEKMRDAEKAADDAESAFRNGTWRDPAAGQVLFKDWANDWYASLELSWSTMVNYRRHLVDHLLPFFGEHPLIDVDQALIVKWKRREKAAGYAADSIRTWAGTLHAILDDAVPRYLAANPAAKKRGKGKRSGAGTKAAAQRGPEIPVMGPLGVLLLAERVSVLTGRDDEFVMVLTGFWGALRWGETVGLEREYVLGRRYRPKGLLRVEWQLYEIDASGDDALRSEAPGGFLRCPPKDDSYGDVPLPPFMRDMLAAHAERVPAVPCPCHGRAFMFRGWQQARTPRGSVPLRDIAALAGVSDTTVSAVLGSRSGTRVGADARDRVMRAAEVAGYRPADRAPEGPAPHWRRSAFGEKFGAAASGQWPARKRNHRAAQSVPLRGEWPGELVSGRNCQGRAEWCWLPLAEQPVHPHLARHWGKTWMEEVGTPEILSESVLRHEIPGVSGAYRHVSAAMLDNLSAAQAEAWESALDARLAMAEWSPVGVLQELLSARLAARKPRLLSRDSPGNTEGVLPFPASTPSGLRRGDRI